MYPSFQFPFQSQFFTLLQRLTCPKINCFISFAALFDSFQSPPSPSEFLFRDKYIYHTCKVLQNMASGYFSDLMILTATCIGRSPFLNLENTLAENEHKWSLLHWIFPSTLRLGMLNTLTLFFHSIFTYFY